MRRFAITPRSDWVSRAEKYGFDFHSIGGVPYWDESVAYAFSMEQIEDHLETATAEIEAMCSEIVDRACDDEEMLFSLGIPKEFHDLIRTSRKAGHASLYGRIDLAYDGVNPPKLYECNSDTPTSLLEAAVFQWTWLEDNVADGVLPEASDQFNSIHERLIAAFPNVLPAGLIHLTGILENPEDEATLRYLEDCAVQSGRATKLIDIADIALDLNGRLADDLDNPIDALFKLYPWEWLRDSAYKDSILDRRTRFLEPPWKAITSNKALLPLLWKAFPGHPNLLPSFFEEDRVGINLCDEISGTGSFVIKPILSREGANIEIKDASGNDSIVTPGTYDGPRIVQAFAPLPSFDGFRPLIGSWTIAGEPAGIGIREDSGPVTGNLSRFIPHVILP